jgi:RNA polymerase sigma-70 factor (ECF subfamily)
MMASVCGIAWGTFPFGKSLCLRKGLQLDTTYALYYNGPAVSRSNPRQLERERFASEIMIHLDHLYRVAFHLVRNDAEARDCVQETCARALGAYGQFTPGSNLKAWLTRILYNFFFDSYARNKRMVAAEDLADGSESAQDYWETLAADRPGPEKQFLQQELGAKISAALKTIPEEFRAPIVLVDMGEFSYAEAAEILSCPVGTVRSRLSRGRRLLQKQLDGYVGGTGTAR